MRTSRSWIAVVVALVGAAAPVSSAPAAFPGQNGTIAAVESGTIFLIDPVTHGRTQLVAGEYPAVSASGERIAYQTAPTSDIHVIGTDGTGDTRLTFHEREDASPSWSPDGTRIAFVSNRNGRLEIYVMNADGTGVSRLTRNLESRGDAYKPAWSPDGSRIAYIGDDGDDGAVGQVRVMNVDGSGDTAITAFRSFTPWGPDWAPDGSRIVFEGNDDQDVGHLYTVAPDGNDLQVLPNTDDKFVGPAFSPDGTRIVFAIAECVVPDIRCGSPLASQRLNGTDRRIEAGGPSGEFWSAPDWGRANSRPECGGVTAQPATLWPPNNQFRTVTLAGGTDPDGDEVTLRVTGVGHDEGTGDSQPGSSPDQVMLRATRDPKGDGRVYTIGFEASDEFGATCTGEATVAVPRHK